MPSYLATSKNDAIKTDEEILVKDIVNVEGVSDVLVDGKSVVTDNIANIDLSGKQDSLIVDDTLNLNGADLSVNKEKIQEKLNAGKNIAITDENEISALKDEILVTDLSTAINSSGFNLNTHAVVVIKDAPNGSTQITWLPSTTSGTTGTLYQYSLEWRVITSEYQDLFSSTAIWNDFGNWADQHSVAINDYAGLGNLPEIGGVEVTGSKQLSDYGSKILVVNGSDPINVDLENVPYAFIFVLNDEIPIKVIMPYQGNLTYDVYYWDDGRFIKTLAKVETGQDKTWDNYTQSLEQTESSDIALESYVDTKVSELSTIIEGKLNQDVVTDSQSAIVGDTLQVTQSKKNLSTGATSSDTQTIAAATQTQAGIMTAADVKALSDLKSKVENLEGKTTRLLYTDKTDPTATEINTFVTGLGYTSPFEGIAVVVKDTYHIWHYYSNDNIGWRDDGLDTTSNFTNEIAGIIKGAGEVEGKVYAETDGTGSVYGWDALKQRVADVEARPQLSSYTDSDFDLIDTVAKDGEDIKFTGTQSFTMDDGTAVNMTGTVALPITGEKVEVKPADDKKSLVIGIDSLVEEITYAELKAKRDAGHLVPGTQYRITDYQCTTTQAETQSAGHQFDIIVTADDYSVLNENAKAIQHSGDTYFSSSELNTWQLKYSIDNDVKKYTWADPDNGKGVIYYMKDNHENECPYDFKNIQFKRYAISFDDGSTTTEILGNPSDDTNKDEQLVGFNPMPISGVTLDDSLAYWVYTFTMMLDSASSITTQDSIYDASVYVMGETLNSGEYDKIPICNNIIHPYHVTVQLDATSQLPESLSHAISLNNIVLYTQQTASKWDGNQYGDGSGNEFKSNCHDITISGAPYANKLTACWGIIAGKWFHSNIIYDNHETVFTAGSDSNLIWFYNPAIGDQFTNQIAAGESTLYGTIDSKIDAAVGNINKVLTRLVTGEGV